MHAGGERRQAGPNVWYSLGLRVGPDGTISDVRWGGPADKAKLAPTEKIIAINGRVPSPDVMHDALVKAKSSSEPIHFIVQSESYIKTYDVDYHDGEKYPVMVKDDSKKDYLDEITAPLTKAP
jgi:predicted metalloprotease with PDZ domain